MSLAANLEKPGLMSNPEMQTGLEFRAGVLPICSARSAG